MTLLMMALSFCSGMAGGILLMATVQVTRATGQGDEE